MKPRYAVVLALCGLAAILLAARGSSDPSVRTITLSARPDAVAVDARTGLAFIALIGGVAGAIGHVGVLDIDSGALERTVAVGSGPVALAIDARTNRVFVANGSGTTVSMLDARSGTVLRTLSVGLVPLAMGIDTRTERVFVIGDEGASVLDAASGKMLARVALSRAGHVGIGSTGAMAVDERTDRVFVVGTLGVAMLDARSGVLLRVTRVGTEPVTVTADEQRGHVFVANFLSNSVSMLNARTGAIMHTTAVGLHPAISAVDARTGLVFLNYNLSQTVTMLSAASGTIWHTATLRNRPFQLAADAPAGIIAIIYGDVSANAVVLIDARTGRGNIGKITEPVGADGLVLLDARTGAVCRTIPLETAPAAMATDDRTGRIIVVANGGVVRPRDPWGWIPPWLRRRLPLLTAPRTHTIAGSVTIIDPS